MKVLTSFRLSPSTKQNLQYLAKKSKLSEADIVEIMAEFVQKSEIEFDFDAFARTKKLEKSPEYKKFKERYDKAGSDEQAVMRRMFIDSDFL